MKVVVVYLFVFLGGNFFLFVKDIEVIFGVGVMKILINCFVFLISCVVFRVMGFCVYMYFLYGM